MKLLNEVIAELETFDDGLFYVYVMYKPTEEPFYVGKGKTRKKGQRLTEHERQARRDEGYKSNPHFNYLKIHTIKKIWKENGIVFYGIDSVHSSELDCLEREKKLIAQYGRRIVNTGTLTNITEGGDKEQATIPEETRKQISDSLRKYFRENPDVVKEISERGKKRFEDPAAVEHNRQKSIEGKNHEYLAKWREEHPEELEENGKKHSEFMHIWHAANREKTKEIAAKRNEKFRSEEHRQHMSIKTKEYAARRQAAQQGFLDLVRDKLVAEGKIKYKTATLKRLRDWQREGKIDIQTPIGRATPEEWEKFFEDYKLKTSHKDEQFSFGDFI